MRSRRPTARRSALAAFVLAAALAAGAATAGAAPASGGAALTSTTTGRLIVSVARPGDVGRGGVKDPTTRAGERRARARIAALLVRDRLRAYRSVPKLGFVAVQPPASVGLTGLVRRLRGQAGVVGVESEHFRTLRYTPNDPAFLAPDNNSPSGPAQWNLLAEGFPQAWDYSRGAGVAVGVVDTGIDGSHPDLSGRIIHAVDQVASGNARSDASGHGTHVSGLACGAGDNGYGIVGAGFRCDLVVEKAATGYSLDDSVAAQSIADAVAKGAKVVNMSFGGNTAADSTLKPAIAYACSQDAVLVAAAQNTATQDQGYPARYLQPRVGPGGADGINSFSCSSDSADRGLVVTGAYYGGQNADTGSGPGVSLAAYGFSTPTGHGVFSAFPTNHVQMEDVCLIPTCIPPEPACNCRANFFGDIRFAYLQGTSMATPQVSGAAALIRAYRPNLTAKQVIYTLKRYASGNGTWSDQLGWGILDAGAALKALAPPNCIFNWSTAHQQYQRSSDAAYRRRHRLWHRRHPEATGRQHRAWHRSQARAMRAADLHWRQLHPSCV